MADPVQHQSLFMEPDVLRAVPTQPEAVPDEDLGPCTVLIDHNTKEECGKDGVKKVQMGTKAIPVAAVLCREHAATHNRMFAERRTTR